ncbi:alpha/beta hydrolase [Streptomyces sp. NPDC101132]|uniref:alpha/beta hydrolase n=1 Tax=Streptomyces sp. NPDC101132 TaxID=3366110 RepID=UPI00382C34FE
MGLTSTSFLVLLAVLTALAMLATLLLWARLPGPGWLRWTARLAMIALCQLTAVATVGAWVNNSYGLYASWNDLLGTGATDTVDASMPGPPARRAQFTPGASGTLSTYFRGTHSRLSGEVLVWTPPGYDDPAQRTTRYPVVMLLHGIPGAPESWLEHGGMPDAYRRFVDDGTAGPAILVMPTIDPGGIDTDCVDTPLRKNATWLAEDVTELVADHFRTLPAPGGWGLMGISTGGYCAARLPLQYPRTFTAGVALDPDPLSGDPDVIPDAALRARTSPLALVKDTRADVSLFLATSRQDRDSPVGAIEEFARAAAGTPVRLKTLVVPEGGHNFQTWTGMYPSALPWLSDRLTPAAGTDQPTAGSDSVLSLPVPYALAGR